MFSVYKCASIDITSKHFIVTVILNVQKMLMFTADSTSVMLGKQDGVAAILRRPIPKLCEQHCVAQQED